MKQKLRWGILGTGNIARQFADGMPTAQRSVLTAIGSRTTESARDFANTYQTPSALGSYDALIRDPNVDAVYNSLPNSMHHEWTIKALRAGKHVLCEKPFASNLAQSQEMFDVSRRQGLVLMEAFMYRSHPQTLAIVDAIRGGAIGHVKLIRSSFCYRTTRIAGNIRFSSELAGGAMMDIGCYCTSLSRLIAGAEPTRIHAVGQLHRESGIDEIAAGVMEFPGGITASFTCGMSVQADNAASICGTEGYIQVPVPWKPPVRDATWIIGRATPPRQDKPGGPPAPPPTEVHTVSAGKDLYALEADDFAEAVLDGKPPRVSQQDTLGNMRVLDEIRRQIGVRTGG